MNTACHSYTTPLQTDSYLLVCVVLHYKLMVGKFHFTKWCLLMVKFLSKFCISMGTVYQVTVKSTICGPET